MDEEKIYEQMEQDIIAFANKYSLKRLKLSTVNFDREYRRGVDGNFNLVSTKAVIRVLGKKTKVPLGVDEAHQTFGQAFEATRQYWSEYYKEVRANRSPAQLKAEARRQKRYREQRKQDEMDLKRQQ
ncbi:hypothetical protein BH23PAT2_BH23PAT2_08220 [soil metagenome]